MDRGYEIAPPPSHASWARSVHARRGPSASLRRTLSPSSSLGVWALGPYVPRATPLLIPLALLGMTVSVFGAGRYLVRRTARKGLVRPPLPIRWQTTRSGRRRLELAKTPTSRPLPLHIHAL